MREGEVGAERARVVSRLEAIRRELVSMGVLPTVRGAWAPVEASSLPTQTEVLPVGPSIDERSLTDLLGGSYGMQGAEPVALLTGPTVTTHVVRPAPGTRLKDLLTRSSDISRDLGVVSVRLLSSVPGYPGCIGLEVPNGTKGLVSFREVLGAYQEGRCRLPVMLGKSVTGRPVSMDLASAPHLLVAGTTGSGKSVFLHGLVCSLVSLLPPGKLQLYLVDPKRVEFQAYGDLPHLGAKVAYDQATAAVVVAGLVDDMEKRFRRMEVEGVQKITDMREPPPYKVLVVDEFADLAMMGMHARDIEDGLIRLAQKARAVGIHVVIATQKLAGVVSTQVRANFPGRATFRVADERKPSARKDFGPEDLLGNGDMLVTLEAGVERVQCAYIDNATTKAVVKAAGG